MRDSAANGASSAAGRDIFLADWSHRESMQAYTVPMLASPALGLSGMNAAQVAMRTAGHNMANLGTEGFHRQQVVQAEAPSGGVSTTLNRAEKPGAAMETDVVSLLQAKHAFLANLAVFRTSDRLMGSLLDTVG